MESGVYQIRGPNGKFYAGSTQDFAERWTSHRSSLRGKRHHCKDLQDAWNEHGEAAFSFEPLMCFPIDEMMDAEQDVLHTLWDTGVLYNTARYVYEPQRGVEKSAATREKIRITKLNQSPETRALIGLAHKGKKHRPESIEKMRLAKLGKKFPPGFNRDTTKMYGNTNAKWTPERRELFNKLKAEGKSPFAHSQKTRDKIGAAGRGRVTSEKTKELLRQTSKGRPGFWTGKKFSPEARAKMSASQKARRLRGS